MGSLISEISRIYFHELRYRAISPVYEKRRLGNIIPHYLIKKNNNSGVPYSVTLHYEASITSVYYTGAVYHFSKILKTYN